MVIHRLSFFLILLVVIGASCTPHTSADEPSNRPPLLSESEKARQQAIIDKYLIDSARQYSYYSYQWQYYIDMGLREDSTIAYLWQQKAMPMFKQGKYEKGMEYLDKAAFYQPESYQNYRAFIKCIFAKTYRDAIADFDECLQRDGNSFVMDHSYNFYKALCHLQLNEFAIAEQLFKQDTDSMGAAKGEEWIHHLDLFYYGISQYEQQQYEAAIATFDRALDKYPRFSDVQYYQAICLAYMDRIEEANALIELARQNAEQGYSITEDNAVYERYPYQVRW